MQNKYYQIYLLLEEPSPWNPRLDKIQKIVRRPDFRYKKEDGADFILTIFLRSCYWLNEELLDESYLYKKEKQNLLSTQKTHLKMVNIGALLLSKGFPLKYTPSEYNASGPNQLGSYVKTFVRQCQKSYALFYRKISHKNQIQTPKNLPKTKE